MREDTIKGYLNEIDVIFGDERDEKFQESLNILIINLLQNPKLQEILIAIYHPETGEALGNIVNGIRKSSEKTGKEGVIKLAQETTTAMCVLRELALENDEARVFIEGLSQELYNATQISKEAAECIML